MPINDEFTTQTEEMQDLTATLMDVNARKLDEAKRALSEREKKYLEYFWNSKTREIRKSLPESMICFFESEPFHDSLASKINAQVHLDLLKLSSKGYIERLKFGTPKDYVLTGQGVYELTRQGVDYLKDAHPKLIVLLEDLWERAPTPLKFAGSIIGFIASVFGIIQFFFWLFKKQQ